MKESLEAIPILAKLADVQGQPLGKLPGLLLGDVLLIIAAALTVLLLVLLWAKYLRGLKPKKQRDGGQKVYRESDSPDEEVPEDESAAEMRRRYKYRYKRRGHRTRNPTLGETGGLPPTRSEEPTEPS